MRIHCETVPHTKLTSTWLLVSYRFSPFFGENACVYPLISPFQGHDTVLRATASTLRVASSERAAPRSQEGASTRACCPAAGRRVTPLTQPFSWLLACSSITAHAF